MNLGHQTYEALSRNKAKLVILKRGVVFAPKHLNRFDYAARRASYGARKKPGRSAQDDKNSMTNIQG